MPSFHCNGHSFHIDHIYETWDQVTYLVGTRYYVDDLEVTRDELVELVKQLAPILLRIPKQKA